MEQSTHSLIKLEEEGEDYLLIAVETRAFDVMVFDNI